MSKKVCEIPSRWSVADYANHSCSDRSHHHVSRTQASEDVKLGLAEWVRPPSDRRGRLIVRMIARNVGIRGLSSAVGEYLRVAVAQKEGWAVAMLRSIQLRRESPSPGAVQALAK